jgi:hypothetical protein
MGISYIFEESVDSQLRLPLRQANPRIRQRSDFSDDDSALTRVPSAPCLKRYPSDQSIQRKVSFDLDNNLVIPNPFIMEEEEAQQRWLSDADLKAIHKEVKEVGKFHKQHRQEYIETCKHVWDLCAIAPKDHTRSSDSMARSQAIARGLAREEEARGCEAACSSLAKKHRQEHSAKVLRTQQQLRENKEGVTTDFQQKILATRSMQSSRQSKLFARAYGEADAIAGVSIYI